MSRMKRLWTRRSSRAWLGWHRWRTRHGGGSRVVERDEANVRPAARLQNPKSQARYAGYTKRFICYCLRIAAALDDDTEEEEEI